VIDLMQGIVAVRTCRCVRGTAHPRQCRQFGYEYSHPGQPGVVGLWGSSERV